MVTRSPGRRGGGGGGASGSGREKSPAQPGRVSRRGKEKVIFRKVRIEHRAMVEPHFAVAYVTPENNTIIVTLNTNHELYNDVVTKGATARNGRGVKRRVMIKMVADEIAKAAAQRGAEVMAVLADLVGGRADEEDSTLVFKLSTAIYGRATARGEAERKEAA